MINVHCLFDSHAQTDLFHLTLNCLGTFCDTNQNTNVHNFTLNLHINNDGRKFPLKSTTNSQQNILACATNLHDSPEDNTL